MSTPSFLQVLTYEVGRLQAAHPEREAELARAHALILHGMVTPSPDDPAEGRVLASDMQKVYHVNGTCDCGAGQHGKDCKHQHAWKLYRYVERKLAAQPAEDQDYICNLERHSPQPLYEAPASANCHLTISGRQVQLTLRDHDEGRLLERLATVLAQYPAPGNEFPTAAPTHGQEGWCGRHGLQMRWNAGKGGRQGWYSHKTAAGQWCQGH